MLPLTVPVELDRATAQRAAARELSKQVYRAARPGLLERILRWADEQFQWLADGAASVSPRGYVGLALLVILLVAAVVAIRLKVGPLSRSARTEGALFPGRVRTAAEHRNAADAHAAAGEWDRAVRERLRAVVRSLEERTLIEPRPGRTADEAAAEAGRVLPDCADGLRTAAVLFDDIWYGGRSASEAAYRSIVELDGRVSASRAVLAPVPGGRP